MAFLPMPPEYQIGPRLSNSPIPVHYSGKVWAADAILFHASDGQRLKPCQKAIKKWLYSKV